LKNSELLASRFREVLLDGKWIANTNFLDQLQNLQVESANKKIGDHNSIAALCFHVDYSIEGVLKVLNGGPLEIKDKFSFDHPEVNNQQDWESMVLRLKRNSEQFADRLEEMNDLQLAEVFVDPKYGTYQRNIEAMIEHAYYHLGQIVLLKKLIGQ